MLTHQDDIVETRDLTATGEPQPYAVELANRRAGLYLLWVHIPRHLRLVRVLKQ